MIIRSKVNFCWRRNLGIMKSAYLFLNLVGVNCLCATRWTQKTLYLYTASMQHHKQFISLMSCDQKDGCWGKVHASWYCLRLTRHCNWELVISMYQRISWLCIKTYINRSIFVFGLRLNKQPFPLSSTYLKFANGSHPLYASYQL